MVRYITFLFIFVAVISSCSKVSKNAEVAQQLKGEWNAISLQVDDEETVIANLSSVVATFFDFEDAKGRYNLKIYISGNIAAETEGTAEVKIEGTQLVLIEDNTAETQISTIETLTDNLLKINGSNDNGEIIVFIGEKN